MERWSGLLDWITGVPRTQIYYLLEATPTNVQLAWSAMARNSSSTLKRLARATLVNLPVITHLALSGMSDTRLAVVDLCTVGPL